MVSILLENKKAQRRIDKEKEDLDLALERNPNRNFFLSFYNKNMENIDGDSFGAGILTSTGVTNASIYVLHQEKK